MTTRHLLLAALLAGLSAPALAEDTHGALAFYADGVNLGARTGVTVMRGATLKNAP